MEQYKQDCVVIGAGVVGLAIAAELAKSGRDVVVLEANKQIGFETSSRNSEVIHAGIYYEEGSLKKELCVKGKKLLYEYCKKNNVQHKRCEKIIVANSEAQLNKLEAIYKSVNSDDVPLQLLTKEEVNKLESELVCVGGLLSESTGIVDSHKLMESLQRDLEAYGGKVLLKNELQEAELTDAGLKIKISGDDRFIEVNHLINSGGLHADKVALKIKNFPQSHIPKIYYAKGNYFSISGKVPFNRLIYPMPEEGGLGVHLTLDMEGNARFGPDVEWVETIDYRVNEGKIDDFYGSIRKYWPGLKEGTLSPSYSGIRAKLYNQDDQIKTQDFRIEGKETHGISQVVNLFGIESPGLTSSLAIADRVKEIIEA